MNDALDKAVKAATAKPVERRAHVNVTVASTGRIITIECPVDLTDGEIAEFMGWCGTGLLKAARDQRMATANGRILLPT